MLTFQFDRKRWLSLSRAPVIVLLLAVSPPAFAQQQLPPALEALFNEGVKALKENNLNEAEQAFRRVIERGGRVAFVFNNLGIVHQQRGDHQKAVAQFREAIRLEPDYPAPRLLIGSSLLAQGHTTEAARQLERAVKLLPQEPQAHLQLAKAYERAGDLLGAVDQYRALRELRPREPEYAYQMGKAYLKLSEWSFQQMMRAHPRSARLYQALGHQYILQGKPELAIQTLQRAVNADPTLPEVHLVLAQIHLERKEIPEARREIELELKLIPESRAALLLKQKIEAAHAGA
ncbi:MAG: tetratricopeptide repeat protein, partial [Pyrinomonadaceae bacterium]|nr:tetratricopeptide repeat protein [Pyrinomonadaceae bacterium]